MQGDKLYFDIKQKLKIIKTIQYQFLKKRERKAWSRFFPTFFRETDSTANSLILDFLHPEI